MIRTARLPGLLAGAGLVATLLAGCGGDDPVPVEPTGAPPAATSDSSGDSASAESSTASEPAAEASSLPVPPDGPTAITEFPVPAGAEIVDIGPPLGGNWQFGISSPDPATTIEFYLTTLAAEGYTFRENVSVVVGENTIEYDLAFFGTTFGIVDQSDLVGGTLVTVDDEPLDGVTP